MAISILLHLKNQTMTHIFESIIRCLINNGKKVKLKEVWIMMKGLGGFGL